MKILELESLTAQLENKKGIYHSFDNEIDNWIKETNDFIKKEYDYDYEKEDSIIEKGNAILSKIKSFDNF